MRAASPLADFSRPLAGRIAALAPMILSVALTGCDGCKNKDKEVADDINESVPPEPVPYTNDWGQWLTMAVTPDGQPAAAAYDLTQGALTYAVGEVDGEGNVTWTHEEVDGYADAEGLDQGDRGTYASMAIAADGRVWVAYHDNKVLNLRYATRDPATGAWTTGIADKGAGATPQAGQWASLALDASNNPVVVHYDIGKANLRVARWDGTAFSGDVVDEGEGTTDTAGEEVDADVGKYARLKIVGGVEYIAYYDAANGALKLAHGSAGSYTVETVDDTADVGTWPDMIVDDQGKIQIAYQDVTNQDLKFAEGTAGGTWTLSTVDSGEYRGADAALFMNGSYPAIVYFDGRENNVMLAQNAGDTWTEDTVAGDGAALGFHNEVITASGVRYAGCFDYTNRTVWFQKLD